MNETSQFGKGAIHSTSDSRDYIFLGKSTTPYDWTKTFNIEEIVGIIPPKNQGQSYSCGGQAWSYCMAVLDSIKESWNYKEKSAKYIYSQTYVAGGGSDGRTNSALCVNQGDCVEPLCLSYENGQTPTELFMERPQDITPQAKNDAQGDETQVYASIPTYEIESVAQAIRDNNGCVLEVEGMDNGTWLSDNPQKPASKDWAHFLYAGKIRMNNGIKQIGVINSWGNVGENGWQWLNEDYFTSGNIFAGWVMTSKNTVIVPAPIVVNVQVTNWYQRFIALLKNAGLLNK